MVSGWNGRLYFVYIPSSYSENILPTVTELEIPIIDIQREVIDPHPDPLSLYPLRKVAHFNAEGYRLIAETISNKLIRRHPHVFGDIKADAAFNAKQNWEAEKQKEKKRESRLDGVPVNLPGLVRAQRLQEKAAYVGFDWEKIESVWEKVHEELEEVKLAQKENNKESIKEEIGDAIFALVNLARFLGIPAEDALRRTNNKFINRFKMIEKELIRRGKEVVLYDLSEQIFRVKDQINNKVQVYYGSILDESSIREAIRGCDGVVHLAAYLGVRRTEINKIRCLDININGTRTVLDAVIKHNLKKVDISKLQESTQKKQKTKGTSKKLNIADSLSKSKE